MNVASLARCKELYELSGWANPSYAWYDSKKGQEQPYSALDVGDAPLKLCPAYDLGYLLRKLPHFLSLTVDGESYDCRLEVIPAGFGNKRTYKTPGYKPKPKPTVWCADYSDIRSNVVKIETGESPEDAACRLAIELFKQGILKRDRETV